MAERKEAVVHNEEQPAPAHIYPYLYPIIAMREHCHVWMAFAMLSSLRRLGLLLGGLLGLASFPLANGEGGSLSENPLDGESVVV